MGPVPLENVCDASGVSCFGECVDGVGCTNCPEGFEHETSLFHLANCSQPVVLIQVLCGFLVAGCTLFEVALLPRLVRSRGDVRVILSITQFSQLCLLIASIIELAQGYASPAYLVMMTFTICAIALSFHLTMRGHARIFYKTANQRFPEREFRTFMFFSVSTVCAPFFFVFLPGSSFYMTNVQLYNTLIAVTICSIPLNLVATVPVLLVSSSRLVGSIKTTRAGAAKSQASVGRSSKLAEDLSNESDKNRIAKNVDMLLRRLYLFKWGFVLLIVPIEVISCVLISCLYLIWRLPFLWLIHCLLVLLVFTCNVVLTMTSSQWSWRTLFSGKGGISRPLFLSNGASSTENSSTAYNNKNMLTAPDSAVHSSTA